MTTSKSKASANPLDDLLSPERLRRNWRKVKPKAVASQEQTVEEETPQLCYQTLRSLINKRFTGDDAEVLNRLLDELGALLGQGPAGDGAPRIDEVLNLIEDLVEAFEIRGQGHS